MGSLILILAMILFRIKTACVFLDNAIKEKEEHIKELKNEIEKIEQLQLPLPKNWRKK